MPEYSTAYTQQETNYQHKNGLTPGGQLPVGMPAQIKIDSQ